MSNNDFITMICEKFDKGGTGQKVDGITVIIDGKLKDIFDIIISRSEKYENHTEILRDSLFMGINEIMNTLKK